MKLIFIWGCLMGFFSCFVNKNSKVIDQKSTLLQKCVNHQTFMNSYKDSSIYILENDLIHSDEDLQVYWKNTKVRVIKRDSKEKSLITYLTLADYTLVDETARIQLGSSNNFLYNFFLNKIDDGWVVVNSIVIQDK
mgnify:CR=1 FL=1